MHCKELESVLESEGLGQLPRDALIDPRRIREPVRDDPGSLFERGRNRLIDMVDAGGREDKRLHLRAVRRKDSTQNDLSQNLGAGRAARLAGA